MAVGREEELKRQVIAKHESEARVCEAVERSVGEVEIVTEIHSLIKNLVEPGEKNRLKMLARIDSVKGGMEGSIVKVAQYASEIQDSVVPPARHLIPASWFLA